MGESKERGNHDVTMTSLHYIRKYVPTNVHVLA